MFKQQKWVMDGKGKEMYLFVFNCKSQKRGTEQGGQFLLSSKERRGGGGMTKSQASARKPCCVTGFSSCLFRHITESYLL